MIVENHKLFLLFQLVIVFSYHLIKIILEKIIVNSLVVVERDLIILLRIIILTKDLENKGVKKLVLEDVFQNPPLNLDILNLKIFIKKMTLN